MTKPWRFVLAGGLVVGTFDLAYACIFWAIQIGVSPQRVLQSIAAGWLGDASRTGGWATAALGLVSHYGIACAMAVTYYVAARRWSVLWERPVAWGAAYGLLLYGIMNHIVMPLSAAGPGSKDPLWVALSIVVHMLLVGLPCALFARRAILSHLRAPATPDVMVRT